MTFKYYCVLSRYVAGLWRVLCCVALFELKQQQKTLSERQLNHNSRWFFLYYISDVWYIYKNMYMCVCVWVCVLECMFVHDVIRRYYIIIIFINYVADLYPFVSYIVIPMPNIQ